MLLHACSICQQAVPNADLFAAEQVRPAVRAIIAKEIPDWNEQAVICESCLDRFRARHLQNLIEQERGELSALDEQVLASISEHELVTRNIDAQYDRALTFGQRLSDRMASFGGSWLFLILFASFLTIWIALNSVVSDGKTFDPFPYILLNLILSCLAAVQAPIIMMSQNRQEAKDRLRSEHDYQVNLKAELEIRQLHMKIDQLLKHQWSRLLEIQQLQVELMQQHRHNHEAKI